MSYVIAKKIEEMGCVAVEAEGGKSLAHLVSYLSLKTFDKGIEILVVSNPEVYGEYKPYHFVASEKDFIIRVLEL